VVDIINSPIDSFNELLTRPGLTAKQIKVFYAVESTATTSGGAVRTRTRTIKNQEERR